VLHNEELCHLYTSPSTVRTVKLNRSYGDTVRMGGGQN